MIQRYLDNIKPFNPKSYKGGVCFSNDKFKACFSDNPETKILENVYKYEFKRLYPNLLIQFNNIGINLSDGSQPHLSNVKIDDSIIDRVEYLLNLDVLTDPERIWMNSLYIAELKKYTPVLFDLYYQYMIQFYDDLNEKHDIIYVDTDMIVSNEEIDISEIGIKYTKNVLPYFWIDLVKKYVYFENGVSKIKGAKSNDKRILSIINEIKKRNRDRNLESILN